MTAVAGRDAAAQTLTSRASTVNYNYVYGAGGDTHSDNVQILDGALLATDAETAHYDGSTSGVLPGGTPYSAGVDVQLDHNYTITGPLNAFSSIHAEGVTDVSSAISGGGVATMQSTNPGNRLLFHFETTTPMHYRLSGEVALPAASFFSYVTLQRFDGFTWAYVATTAFSPNAVTPFDFSATLQPGQYRLDANLALGVNASASQHGTYQYTLSIFKPGDMNCDGVVNGLDVMPFVTALLNPAAYATTWPACEVNNADVNQDTAVNVSDVAAFVQCVRNGGC